MEFPSEIIRDVVKRLTTIPGIGQRSAIRIVLDLLKKNREDVEALAEAIHKLKTDIVYCKQCHNISDHELCNICNNPLRDKSVICIVEDIRDVLAIENTSQFKGLFYVLGGLISPVDGVGPSDIKIGHLLERIATENIKEIIFALNPTVEGDTTTFYIAKQITKKEIRMSTLSRGISIGGELEFADEVTLGRSILNRIKYSL